MANLYLVRHGQTEFSRENRFCGTTDPPLTDVGQAMAAAFAKAYAATTWAAIYTSPMIRARQTAEPLERVAGVTATVEDGLTEIAYGEWEGLTVDEVKTLGDRTHLPEALRVAAEAPEPRRGCRQSLRPARSGPSQWESLSRPT